MDHSGVNILTPFFYLSLYSLESLVVIGKFSYEDRFVLTGISCISIGCMSLNSLRLPTPTAQPVS